MYFSTSLHFGGNFFSFFFNTAAFIRYFQPVVILQNSCCVIKNVHQRRITTGYLYFLHKHDFCALFTTLHKSFCHNKGLWCSLPLTAGHYISSLAHVPPLMPRGIDSVPLPRGYILNERFDTRVRCHILYTEVFPWMITRQPVGMFPYIRRTCCELSVSFSVIFSCGFRLSLFFQKVKHPFFRELNNLWFYISACCNLSFHDIWDKCLFYNFFL